MHALEIDYTMTLEFSVPVIDHFFVLRCLPVSRGCQTVTKRELSIEPMVNIQTTRDVFGNLAYRGQLKEPHKAFSFKATATVQVNTENSPKEKCLSLYKYGTALTFATDEMKIFLKTVFSGTEFEEYISQKKIPSSMVRPFAEKLSDSLHNFLEYKPGSTTVKTTAGEAFEKKMGVCQDFAHIFCSLCRIVGIPSRYVCGTSKGEGSTHAWVEVFVADENYVSKNSMEIQGRWFGIDPTRNRFTNDDYIILAVGRDFNDCQVDRGIFRGNADQIQTVFVKTKSVEVPDYVTPEDYKPPKNYYAPVQPHDQQQQQHI